MYKQAKKEKKIRENMRGGDGELEKLLNEIPYATSLNNLHNQNHHKHLCMSVSSPPLISKVSHSPSSSSSISGGFCYSDKTSSSSTPSPTLFEESANQAPYTHYLEGLWSETKPPGSRAGFNNNEYSFDELGLSENLYRMSIREKNKDCGGGIRQFQVDPDGFGFGFGNGSFVNDNVAKYDPCEGIDNGVSDYGGFRSFAHGVPVSFDDDMESALLRLQKGYEVGDSMGSCVTHNRSSAMYSESGLCKNQMKYLLEQRNERGSSGYHRGIQFRSPSMNGSYLNDALFCSQQCGMDLNMERGGLNSLNSPQLMHPRLALNVENSLCNRSVLKERTRASSNDKVPQSIFSVKGAEDIEAFSCEDGFIIQGRNLNYVINKGCDRSRSRKKNSGDEIATRKLRERNLKMDAQIQAGGIRENSGSPMSYCLLPLQPDYSSLAEVQGYIYFLAKDQNGCRFLQKMLDEGTFEHVQIIFSEIIVHVIELMMNPFGNYLLQKLLGVCNEEQRMQIVLMVTEVPGQLVRISLNTHGTRVVQKLIETLKTRQQISSVIMALEPGFLDLIKDLNGNHVIQRCLQCLSKEDNEFIFDAAAKLCVDMATHRHGCCVLQRCIGHSTGEHRKKLVAEISANGLFLSQDAFGNYAVQYIIEQETSSAIANLISQFEGNYVHLSMQKFSSHVVEKCLRYFEECRPRIIHELLLVPHFEQLLQDPYANYVVQSALEVTKGPLHATLVEAVRPHTILRTSPYCKRIFSRNLLKK